MVIELSITASERFCKKNIANVSVLICHNSFARSTHLDTVELHWTNSMNKFAITFFIGWL